MVLWTAALFLIVALATLAMPGRGRGGTGGEVDRAAHDVFIDWLRVGETV